MESHSRSRGCYYIMQLYCCGYCLTVVDEPPSSLVSRQMRFSLKHTICIALKATTVATQLFGPQVLSCKKEQTWIHIVGCDGGNGGALVSQGSLFKYCPLHTSARHSFQSCDIVDICYYTVVSVNW